jgi:hypothetical protein
MTIYYMRYYKLRCPYCGTQYQTSLLPSSERLGPRTRICGSCKRQFSTGLKEWPEMTPQERRDFFFDSATIIVWLFIAAGLIFLYLWDLRFDWERVEPSEVLWGILGFFVLFLGQQAIRGAQIASSKRRYQRASSLSKSLEP